VVEAATNVRAKDQVSAGVPDDGAAGAADEMWAIPGEGNLLDDTNRAIIESLQRDGRRAYAQIAGDVGLSEAAVRRRVQQLRASGVIQIVAVTDPLQLGFTRQAMIGISVEGDVRSVAAKIVPLPEVDYVVMCAGSFDLLVEVVCEGDERLLHILNDSIRSVPGVRSTETFMYLKLAKQTYTWGTR
jgi:Lrp/AsnC family transcriptional regulator for asnA, asnC and gidA